MSKVCLLVLSGLPASGKTLLSKKLVNICDGNSSLKVESHGLDTVTRLVNSYCIHICYDLLIPDDKLQGVDKGDILSTWKTDRQDIVMCVKLMLKNDIFDKPSSPVMDGIPQNVFKQFSEHILPQINKKFSRDQKVLVIIDDNMYYKSMRYDYFQLARELSIGFAEVFITCSPEVAIQQNELRDRKVSLSVIQNMFKKYEPPSEDHWERNHVTVSAEDVKENKHLHSILAIVDHAWNNPVPPMEVTDPSRTEESRQRCMKSILHQSDLILRQLVGQELRQIQTKISKQDMKTMSKTMSALKSQILSDIESGKVEFALNESEIENSSKNVTSDLYVGIKEIFKSQYSAKGKEKLT